MLGQHASTVREGALLTSEMMRRSKSSLDRGKILHSMTRAPQRSRSEAEIQYDREARHIRDASCNPGFDAEAVGAYIDCREAVAIAQNRAAAAELEAMRVGMPGSWSVPGGRNVHGSPIGA